MPTVYCFMTFQQQKTGGGVGRESLKKDSVAKNRWMLFLREVNNEPLQLQMIYAKFTWKYLINYEHPFYVLLCFVLWMKWIELNWTNPLLIICACNTCGGGASDKIRSENKSFNCFCHALELLSNKLPLQLSQIRFCEKKPVLHVQLDRHEMFVWTTTLVSGCIFFVSLLVSFDRLASPRPQSISTFIVLSL